MYHCLDVAYVVHHRHISYQSPSSSSTPKRPRLMMRRRYWNTDLEWNSCLPARDRRIETLGQMSGDLVTRCKERRNARREQWWHCVYAPRLVCFIILTASMPVFLLPVAEVRWGEARNHLIPFSYGRFGDDMVLCCFFNERFDFMYPCNKTLVSWSSKLIISSRDRMVCRQA